MGTQRIAALAAAEITTLNLLLKRVGELSWLDTDAGHLVLMTASARLEWSGIEPSRDPRAASARFRWNKPSDAASDYDRACDVDDYVGIIDVGSQQAVVLGQEPLPATVITRADGSLLIARLYTSEFGLPSQLPVVDGIIWESVGSVTFSDSALVLFDSTDVGWETPAFPSISIEFTPGRYDVQHVRFNNHEMELWLVRLVPITALQR